MANPRSAWGIDVGNRALKAVHLVRTGEGVRIDDFELIEHEHILSQAGDNRESLIQSALANFTQRHSIKGSACAVGVSGQASFARFIKLPPVEPKKIPEIVRFEAIQQIPFPLDDVEWSYQLFQDPQSPDVEVGIFAMRRDLVNQHIQYFTETGLNVVLVQMNPLAVYNAMYHDDHLSGATMIVDIGAENTDLIIAEGETIWLRSVPIGGNAFTESLVKSFKLKFTKAEELKRNAATSKYGRQILQAMRPVFADLVAEIQRSIGFYSSVHRESRIARVLTLGGTFRLPGLQKYLQQNLQLELVRVDRLGAGAPNDARLAALLGENILSSASAYGLALQALGTSKITSSLLPAAIRHERMWREKNRWFAAAAALFVVGAAVPVASWYLSDLKMKDDDAKNQPIIAKVMNEGQKYTDQWNALTNSGEADRKQIADFNALQQDREFWNSLVPELYAAFVPPSPGKTEDRIKIPRSSRREVLLDNWKAKYLGPDQFPTVLSLPEEAFRLQADLSDSGGGGSRALGGAPGAVAAAPGSQRGYLITLRCITPNSGGSGYIGQTLVKALRDRNVNAKNPPDRFSIDRVVMVNEQKLGNDTRFAQHHGGQHSSVFRPADTGARSPAAPFPAPGGFMSLQPPSALPKMDENDPYRDPATDEDMRNDTIVTVLAAVTMDPVPATPQQGDKASVADVRP